MELTFLGMRGGIELRSRLHRRHSLLLVEHLGARIMVECGADWLGRLDAVAPTAIVLTHARVSGPCPGLRRGGSLSRLRDQGDGEFACLFSYPAAKTHTAAQSNRYRWRDVRGLPVCYSIRAPGSDIVCPWKTPVFSICPTWPNSRWSPMRCGCSLYVGDGATILRTMVRRKNGTPIGHAPVAAHLG